MRARHWSLITILTGVALGGIIATLPRPAKADGKKLPCPVSVHKDTTNGVVTSFTAEGSLGSARSDVSGLSLNCRAVDGFNKQVDCVVADIGPAGYVARLAAIGGDSYIWFSGQLDTISGIPGYTCTGLEVSNRSVFAPKQQ
jgi:hypothetical protein